jgi:hypothetical protein
LCQLRVKNVNYGRLIRKKRKMDGKLNSTIEILKVKLRLKQSIQINFKSTLTFIDSIAIKNTLEIRIFFLKEKYIEHN